MITVQSCSFYRESWEQCGQREVLEETGLRLTGVRFSTVVNAVLPEEDYHYITLFVQGYVDPQHMAEPSNLEPDKCEGVTVELIYQQLSCLLPVDLFVLVRAYNVCECMCVCVCVQDTLLSYS